MLLNKIKKMTLFQDYQLQAYITIIYSITLSKLNQKLITPTSIQASLPAATSIPSPRFIGFAVGGRLASLESILSFFSITASTFCRGCIACFWLACCCWSTLIWRIYCYCSGICWAGVWAYRAIRLLSQGICQQESGLNMSQLRRISDPMVLFEDSLAKLIYNIQSMDYSNLDLNKVNNRSSPHDKQSYYKIIQSSNLYSIMQDILEKGLLKCIKTDQKSSYGLLFL